MDAKTFNDAYDGIFKLNAKEGPTRNIFEPKFQARDQVFVLQATLRNVLRAALRELGSEAAARPVDMSTIFGAECSSDEAADRKAPEAIAAQAQLARTFVFLANNQFETEEEKEALDSLRIAHALVVLCCKGEHTDVSALDAIAEAPAPTDAPVGSPAEQGREVLCRKHLPKSELPAILDTAKLDPMGQSNAFAFMQLYTEVLNTLGIVLSARPEATQRVNDARVVLKRAEALYHSWDSWAVAARRGCRFDELQLKSESGDADFEKTIKAMARIDGLSAGTAQGKQGTAFLSESDARDIIAAASTERRATLEGELRERLRVERLHNGTLFYLAQAFGALSDVRESSRYCHHTMVRQLLSQREYSRKEWATNAVHLSGFYGGEGDFGAALHCLEAARIVMPTADPSDETLGVVAWGFGKVLKSYLSDQAHSKEQREAEGRSADEVGGKADPLGVTKWWVDFPLPGLKPPAALAPPKLIAGFADARRVFRKLSRELTEAAKWYPFDGCCPDFVAVKQDVAEAYRLLAVFEPDLNRRATMQERRAEAISEFPALLSFDAYTVLIRQLLFDAGEAWSELADVRLEQRGSEGEHPGLCARSIAAISDKALRFYDAFLYTFLDTDPAAERKKFGDETVDRLLSGGPSGGGKRKVFVDPRPTEATALLAVIERDGVTVAVDEENTAAVLRALMRTARQVTRYRFKSPLQEYEAIGRSATRYKLAARFAEAAGVSAKHPALRQEADMAQQMCMLLPEKQKDIWRAFQSRQ